MIYIKCLIFFKAYTTDSLCVCVCVCVCNLNKWWQHSFEVNVTMPI